MISYVKKLICISLVGVVSACGGGGGSATSDNSNNNVSSQNFRLSFSPSRLTADVATHNITSSLFSPIEVSYQGDTPSGTVYVYVEHDEIFSKVDLDVGSTSALMFIELSSSAPVGDHSGMIKVDICSDPACNSLITSASYPYSIDITRNFAQFYARASEEEEYEPIIDIEFSAQEWQDPDPLYVRAEPPTGYTSMTLSNELVEKYSVEVLDEFEFVLRPTHEDFHSTDNFEVEFSDGNFVSVATLRIATFPLNPVADKLVFYNQLVHVSANSNGDNQISQELWLHPDLSSPSFQVTYHEGSDWLLTPIYDNGNVKVGVHNDALPTHHGHATVQISDAELGSAEFDVFYLPNMMLWGVPTSTGIEFSWNTTREQLEGPHSFPITYTESINVGSTTPWIHSVELVQNESGEREVQYSVDADLLIRQPVVEMGHFPTKGHIKIESNVDAGQVSIVDVEVFHPATCVERVDPATVQTGVPFQLSAHGDFNIYSLEHVHFKTVGSEGVGVKYDIPDERVESITTTQFEMPALEPGEYQLNFAGLLVDNCTPIFITVE